MSEKKDSWTTYVALSTAIMAVLAAITTLYVGRYSSRTMLLQGQESDQWAYYQAKSIKGHTYGLQRQALELDLLARGKGLSKEARERFDRAVAEYGENLKRYDKEKGEIKEKAEALGKEKELSQAKAALFGYALIFLQIAIMLSSIAAISKKRPLWYFGLATALAGVFFYLDGHYLFY